MKSRSGAKSLVVSAIEGTAAPRDLPGELWNFFLHLRWHYQLSVVSGAYLFGGLYQSELDVGSFLIQFVNVHLFLLGGATVYNSFWDKDEGPIGGLKHPPPLAPWTHAASLVVQLTGVLLASLAGSRFVAVYLVSMLLFWLYSTPHRRWKGHPHKSLVVIGLGNGINLFLLGYLAAGRQPARLEVLAASAGVALVLLSLYPSSQVFQMAEDARRGDRTFALYYGLAGVRWLFVMCYAAGALLIAGTLALRHGWMGGGLLLTATLAGVAIWRVLKGLQGRASEYAAIMRLKYTTSGLFVAFIAACLVFVHLF